MHPIAYHLMMLLVDAALLTLVARRTAFSIAVFAAFLGFSVAFLFAALNLHLFCQGVFWHGGAFLLGQSIIFAVKKRRRLAIVPLILSILALSVGVDSMLIEPYDLQVERHEFIVVDSTWSGWSDIRGRSTVNDRIDTEKQDSRIDEPFRIVFVTDIQTDHVGEYERNALEAVVELEPDLVLFGGDYVQAGSRNAEVAADLNLLMREANFGETSTYGAYAVRGNVDPDLWVDVFEGTDVQVCEQTETFEVGPIVLTTLAVWDSVEWPGLEEEEIPEGKYHVILGHVPTFFVDTAETEEGDLLLAGHTHGGQIRIPGYGPILTLTPRLPRDWAAGLTELEGEDGPRRMIVSRGVGMERGYAPRVRFFCRPDIRVIDLKPDGTRGRKQGVNIEHPGEGCKYIPAQGSEKGFVSDSCRVTFSWVACSNVIEHESLPMDKHGQTSLIHATLKPPNFSCENFVRLCSAGSLVSTHVANRHCRGRISSL